MDKPQDTLVKRQSSYTGDVMHKFHNFPGKYIGPLMNEFPNANGGVPRTDSTYNIQYNGQNMILNWEDEIIAITNKTLKKSNNYRINLEYFHKKPVISTITTTAPLTECNLQYNSSPTSPFKPIIISYPEMNGSERLSTITSKIDNKEILTKVESMNLIMIPKMFTSNQEIILEKVCALLPELKINDINFKIELILEMKCVIHKYAKTIDDIIRLEEVIGLQQAMTAKQFQDQKLIDQGIEEGKEQGAFDLALKFKKIYGIDAVAKITNFTKEELENEKLNNKNNHQNIIEKY